MANPHLSTVLDSFTAAVHKTKNRLVAIPIKTQRKIGLQRRADNHLVLYSIRPSGQGRWNHHVSYLTHDNEFAIPTDVSHIEGGDLVDVKIHRIIPDADALAESTTPVNAGTLLAALGELAGEDDRTEGSQRVDEMLYGDDNG